MTTLREAFVEAIDAAEYDIALERAGYEIYHFFDSDVLHRMILGYRDPQNRELLLSVPGRPGIETEAGRRLLLAALVGHGVGAPTLLRALPPHLHEVRLLAEQDRREYRGDYDMTIAQLQLQPLLSELSQLIGDQKIEALLRHLIDGGPPIFYALDLLSGTWQSRLGRLIRQGVHRPTPFEGGADIVGREVFDELSEHVARSSPGRRHSASVVGLRDAMALAMLAQSIQSNRGKKEKFPLARFYTETPRILNAWEDPDVRARLTYSDLAPGDGPATHVNGVLRNDYYYLVRALLRPLGYNRQGAEVNEEKLALSARRLAASGGRTHTGDVRDAGLSPATSDQRSLEYYIKELTQLSSYTTAWAHPAWTHLVKGLPGHVPAEIAKDLQVVFDGQQQLGRELQDEYQRLVNELRVATESIHEFSELYREVAEVMASAAEQLRPRPGISYLEHFGLRRWGFDEEDIPDEAIRAIVDSFEEWRSELTPPREPASHIAPSRGGFPIEVARRVLTLRDDPLTTRAELADHLAILGFLCMIQAFAMVARWGGLFVFAISTRLDSVRESGTAVGGFSADYLARLGTAVANKVTITAVRARLLEATAAGPMTRVVVNDLKSRAERDAELVDARIREYGFDRSREAIAITQAYILFHTWQAINARLLEDIRPMRRSVREPHLARRSFELCLGALEASTPEHRLYPFLLNYCVYVGAAMMDLGGTEPHLPSELPERLIGLTGQGVWSYRFDDTLGYLNYVRATKALEEYKRDRSDRRALDRAQQLTMLATQSFDHIEERVYDRDITTHRGWLGELRLEVDRELKASLT